MLGSPDSDTSASANASPVVNKHNPPTPTIEADIEELVLSIIREWNEAMMFGNKEEVAIAEIGNKAKKKLSLLITKAEQQGRLDELSKVPTTKVGVYKLERAAELKATTKQKEQ